MAAPLLRRSNPSSARPSRSLSSAFIVVAFWWAATGLTFAAQRLDGAAFATPIVALLLAAGGAWCVHTSRDDCSARGARTAFLGAGLLWWSTAVLFYAGWGISRSDASAVPRGSLDLALRAMAATWRADVVPVAMLCATTAHVWRRPNRLALWSLLAFWVTLQTAKLNEFFGVRSPGADLLPPRLMSLATYFGPPRNSGALYVTISALTAITAVVAARGLNARTVHARHAAAMLTTLLGLAVLEHVALGVSVSMPLWEPFIRVRGP